MTYQGIGGCAIVLSFCSVVAGAYPTSYPFENENIEVADILVETPSFTFEDATDPGGYCYYGVWALTLLGGDLTEDNFPMCWHNTGSIMWVMVKIYGAPPLMPQDTWNCTRNELVFADQDFTGEVDGSKYCDQGECCSHLIGKPKYGDDQMAWHSWANDRSSSGLCQPLGTEVMYCLSVGGHYHLNCLGYLIGPNERLVDHPCFDSFIRYWRDCAVFRQAYAPNYSMGLQEPVSYMDRMSVDEMMTWDGSMLYPDRVCHPYSYYFPSEGSTGTESSSGTGSATSAEDSESPAFYMTMIACLFVAFLG